jgi:hypothetical protein
VGRGTGNNIYQSLGGPVERPLAARVRPEGKHFVSGNSIFLFWGDDGRERRAAPRFSC